MTEPLAAKRFHGVNLVDYGLVTTAVGGVHDLAPAVLDRQWVAGSDMPCDTVRRRALVDMSFRCVVAGDDHADLVAKLDALRPLMDYELGWGEFQIEDRPGLRTLARTKSGFTVRLEAVPYFAQAVEFDWPLERVGWWEDITATDETDPVFFRNEGTLPCFPVYTCTVTDALATGLTFTVGSKTFTYTGALVANDVLVVDVEAMTVTRNGTSAMAYAADDTEWPELVTGPNDLTQSSSNFTLRAVYRNRYK